MKASRFSDAQKAFILKEAEERVPIGDVCRKAGISQATFYSWRKKYEVRAGSGILNRGDEWIVRATSA